MTCGAGCEAAVQPSSTDPPTCVGDTTSSVSEPCSTVPCGTLSEAKAAFLAQHGDAYGYNGWMEQHFQAEVGQRLGPGQHYLDYTGAAQYTNSMITAIMQELTSTAFGNPHSRNPSSAKATEEVTAARALVLQHFNADPEQYYVIFTKGATEGLKMVGEFFPWQSGSTSTSRSNYIYTQANHKSVLGIGAYAKRAGAELHCVSREQMDQWLAAPGRAVPPHSSLPISRSSSRLSLSLSRRASVIANSGSYAGGCGDAGAFGGALMSMSSSSTATAAAAADQAANVSAFAGFNSSSSAADGAGAAPTFHLVAFPAKDNYEGQLYPLSWIQQVHGKSDANNNYLVVLDAAAYAATHPLDLSEVKPDFVPLSFYKLFGYPTGLGALLVRKEAARQLNKVYFGGGSVDYCTAEDVWHVLSAPPAGLEDGTLGYLNIAALKYGFQLLQNLGGMKAVTAHVDALREWTYRQLLQLQHSNGRPLIKLFGRHSEGPSAQCGIFQFQVLTPDADRLPGGLVEAAATAAGLHLRTGCNCNPGRCLANLGITPEEERARAAQGHKGPILIVMRPRASSIGGKLGFEPHNSSSFSFSSSSSRPSLADGSSLKHNAAVGQYAADSRSARPLVPVPLPLGSVRASLGTMSTFEDCYALVRFLALTFRDFEVLEQEVDAGMKVVNVVNDTTVVRVRAMVSHAGTPEEELQAVKEREREQDDAWGDDGDEGLLLYSMLTWAS